MRGGSALNREFGHIRLAEAARLEAFERLAPGEYVIDYQDETDLHPDEWASLAVVEVDREPLRASEGADVRDIGTEAPAAWYQLRPRVQLPDRFNQGAEGPSRLRIVEDQLAQAMVRVGLLRPVMTSRTLEDLQGLKRHRTLIIVPDTNALCNGSLHWLTRSLIHTSLWTLLTSLSLTQVQRRHAALQSLLRQGQKVGHLAQALRCRALVNASLGLLVRLRGSYQEVPVAPSLLRYLRQAGSGDPDAGDVLEDRLLIEAIHSALRPTRTHALQRVLTSDVGLALVLRSEAIPTLYMQAPRIPEGPIPCLRFDPVAGAFQGAPLPALLWELAHTFARVRLVKEREVVVQLDCYWEGKTDDDWEAERLWVASRGVSAVEPATLSPVVEVVPGPVAAAAEPRVSAFTRAAVPEVSLLPVLRLGGALTLGEGDLEELVMRFPGADRPGRGILRMAAEVAIRAGLATLGTGSRLIPKPAVFELDDAVQRGELDLASRIFASYPPYNALLQLIQSRECIEREQLLVLLRERLGDCSKEALSRLVRFPIYLGQAWTDGRVIRDGSRRPDDNALVEAFVESFNRVERDGLASVQELLVTLCRSLRSAPWAVVRRIEEAIDRRLLADFVFQSAAGRPVQKGDEIVRGGLLHVRTEPVAMDRLSVHGAPVFTVSRGQP